MNNLNDINNKLNDPNDTTDEDKLNKTEINELNKILKNKCKNLFIVDHNYIYSREYYNLFIKDVIFEPNNTNDLYFLGMYYQYINKNYELMKKYYLQAIDKGNSVSMTGLGLHYMSIEVNNDIANKYFLMAIDKGNLNAMVCLGYKYSVEKKYDLMKKYYLMAIDKGNTNAMNNLGYYYQFVEKNYDLTKKYYLQAIDKGNTTAMNNLGSYYEQVEKNYDLMKKYYLQAIDKGITTAMNNLGSYYEQAEKNYDLMKKYYLQAIDKGNTTAMNNLGSYYEQVEHNYELAEKYYIMATSEGNPDTNEYLYNLYLLRPPTENKFREFLLTIINSDCAQEFSFMSLFNYIGQFYDPADNGLDKHNILDNLIVDSFCFIIDNDKLRLNNFIFCVKCVINYIILATSKHNNLKNIKHFMEYMGRLYYGHSKKKKDRRIFVKELLDTKKNISIAFMLTLKIFYDEYIENKYSPDGEGFKKAEKNFYSLADKQKK